MVTQQQNVIVPYARTALLLPWYRMQRSLLLSLVTSNKLWSQRIVSCWSVQGDTGTAICSLSSWTLLGIQGFWMCNKRTLYTTLSSSYFNFSCKYWFISNSFCCWSSLVYTSFKSSVLRINYLKEPIPLELPQSCYWLLKLDMSSPRTAFKGLYRILHLLLYVSILYKNGDSDTTEADIFTQSS